MSTILVKRHLRTQSRRLRLQLFSYVALRHAIQFRYVRGMCVAERRCNIVYYKLAIEYIPNVVT